MVRFVQRLLGRCLTGDVSEQILPIFWGAGANGKSTLLSTILEVVGGDYAMKANADLLMAGQGERHPTELTQLFGMRLVVASETRSGRRLNEELVKDLTGGEPIRARRMREDFWEFRPTHKIILLTNCRPAVAGTDDGIWRRLRLVPFEVRFIDPNEPAAQGKRVARALRQDKGLPGKLRAEHPGILRWLVDGCLEWQRHGLTLPKQVLEATGQYRMEEDTVGEFLQDACLVGPGHKGRAGDLFVGYQTWCDFSGVPALKQKTFGEAMTKRGFTRTRSDGMWYEGVAPKGRPQAPAAGSSQAPPKGSSQAPAAD